MSGRWPYLRQAVLDALAEAGQFQEFRQAHPGAQFSHPGSKTQVYVPYGAESITVTRDTAGEALAAAEDMLPDGPGGDA